MSTPMPAACLGLTGSESPAEITARPGLLAALDGIRRQAAVRMGLVADVISANRKLIEDVLYRIRSTEPAGIDPEKPVGATYWSRHREHVDIGR